MTTASSPELEKIWERFIQARKGGDLEGMRAALAAFDQTYDPANLPRYAPQKQMARRGAMLRHLEQAERDAKAADLGEGSW